MATGKDNKYACCTLCLDDGRNTVARHYCVDCETYFCSRCVTCHKLPSLKSHQVNDVNVTSVTDDDDNDNLHSDALDENVRKRRCTLHEDKLIDTFCKDHNEVCCGSCAVVKHRYCTTLSIAVAAKDFKASSELSEFKEALTENLVKYHQEKKKRSDNLDSVGQQKLELIENVDKYEEKIIARIKELANISRNEIRTKYEEHKISLESDIEALDIVTSTSTEYVDKLEQTDEEQLFILIKTRQKVIKDGELLLQAMTESRKNRGIKLCFDKTLDKYLLGMKSMGQVNDADTEHMGDYEITGYQAVEHSKVNINQNCDTKVFIVDMCFTDEDNLLLTDYHNKKLKRLNSLLQFKDDIKLFGPPVAICKTAEHEVAVRIKSTKRVHIVSVGQSMKVTSSFKLADDGWGMMFDADAGEIWACEENKVSVYNKAGNRLRIYDTDKNGEPLFSECRQIQLDLNNQDIYVTDLKKGLVVLDISGVFKTKVSLFDVDSTWPLCLLPGDICLTGNVSTGVIVQVDKDGKQVGNLIDTTRERKPGRTWSVVYDREHSRLIAGGDSTVIFVYTLSAKYN